MGRNIKDLPIVKFLQFHYLLLRSWFLLIGTVGFVTFRIVAQTSSVVARISQDDATIGGETTFLNQKSIIEVLILIPFGMG